MKLRYLIYVMLLPLSACASFQSYGNCDVARTSGVPILQPAAFARHLISTQQVSINSEQGNFEFISQLEVSRDKLTLVALTPIGQKLFQIQYQPQLMNFERFGIPDSFDPVYLLGDISLIYADDATLNRCFAAAKLNMQVSSKPTPQHTVVRHVKVDATSVRIEYSTQDPWQSAIELHNPMRGYTLKVKPLALETL